MLPHRDHLDDVGPSPCQRHDYLRSGPCGDTATHRTGSADELASSMTSVPAGRYLPEPHLYITALRTPRPPPHCQHWKK
jgi:hypothetical protein